MLCIAVILYALCYYALCSETNVLFEEAIISWFHFASIHKIHLVHITVLSTCMSYLCKYRESLSKSGGACVLRGGSVSVQGFPFPQRPTIQGSGPRGRVIENWAGREEPGLGLTKRTGPPQGTVLSKVYMLPRFQLYEALYLYSCLTCLWVRMGVHTSVCSFIGWRQVWGIFFSVGAGFCVDKVIVEDTGR